MTNADVIRNMSDDELYKFLQAIETGDIDYSLTFCSLCKDTPLDCDECFKRWLFGDADDYNGLLADKSINSGYADRKTEPTISKMEQVETMSCQECKHWDCLINADWKCTLKECHYEPKDEPQTDCYKCQDFWNCDGQCDEVEDEPHTIAKDINRRVEMGKKEWNARHIEAEPQTPYGNCQSCLHWVYDGYWYCECNECRYEPKPHTDCAWK